MKILIGIMVLLMTCVPSAGAICTLNNGNLFTAPAYQNSPFDIKITNLEGATNIVEYNVVLNIVGPRLGEMTWDQFGTVEGSGNIFEGKDTFLYPFFAIVDDWTLDISYGLNDIGDATPDLGLLAIGSVNGGNGLYDWKVDVDSSSYIMDSSLVYYNLTGLSMLIIQPEPCTILFFLSGGMIVLKRKRR